MFPIAFNSSTSTSSSTPSSSMAGFTSSSTPFFTSSSTPVFTSSSTPSSSIFASKPPIISSTSSISTTSSISPFNITSTPTLSFTPNSSQIFSYPAPAPLFSGRMKEPSQLQQEKPQQAFAESNRLDDNQQKTSQTAPKEVKTENNGELQDEARNEQGKTESNSSRTESAGKLDKFMYTRMLRGITHNPHFTPLQSYSKRAREKMIVGWDELFEETIDTIQSLTAKTFSANVQELQKTIGELENLGYNVARLNKRIEELADVMDKRDSSEREISALKAKAQNYKEEKKKLETKIACLQAQANNAQVMVDLLTDRVEKMEANVPTIDALFENLAVNPL